MTKNNTFSFAAYITREENGFTALCREADVATEGLTLQETKENMNKAVPRFPFLTKDGWEINIKLHFTDVTPEERERITFKKTATNDFVIKALKELGII